MIPGRIKQFPPNTVSGLHEMQTSLQVQVCADQCSSALQDGVGQDALEKLLAVAIATPRSILVSCSLGGHIRDGLWDASTSTVDTTSTSLIKAVSLSACFNLPSTQHQACSK